MPRYKFSWDNLPPALLRGLKRQLGLEGEASVALRKAYGARPSSELVRDAWEVLLQSWLRTDRPSRGLIVDDLSSRKLGDASIAVRSAAGQLEYLRSCRNSATLRAVVVEVLISVGEQSILPTDDRLPARSKARSKAWPQFVTSLAASLSSLDDDQYMVLERKDRPWYVQFAAQGPSGIRAELVSNSFLGPKDQISKAAIARALSIGWIAPTGDPAESTPENDPDGSPNYFREWDRPVAFIEAARLAVDTLIDVLAVSHPHFLQYHAFTSEGTQILLPNLGLRVRRTEPRQAGDNAVEPLGTEAISQRLLVVLRQVSGNDKLEIDADGDIALQYDSGMVFVRVFGEPPVVRVFSPVLGGVRPSTDLDDKISELNTQFVFTKWLVSDGTIVASIDLFGDPLVEQHVLHACGVVGQTANDLDEQLQERFGGKTFFGDHLPPKVPLGAGGYL